MELPRITYNAISVDFLQHLDEFDVQYPDLSIRNTAASGNAETLVGRTDVMVRAGMSMEVDPDNKRKIRNWFEWAKKGRTWTFAKDSAESVLTILVADAAVGDTTVEVLDASDVVVGKQYVIRTVTLLQILKVSNVSGSDVTFSEPLLFDFPQGSRFRSEEFWPARLLNSTTTPIVQGRVLFGILLEFREDVNDIVAAAAPPDISRPTLFEMVQATGGYEAISAVEDGANGIDNDLPIGESLTEVHLWLTDSSVFANYAQYYMHGFLSPDPLRTLASATIYVRARRTNSAAPGASAPIAFIGIYNAQVFEEFFSGAIVQILGSNDDEIPVQNYSHTFNAADFATNFPGGASDIWVNCAQWQTTGDCFGDMYIADCWIEYTYA